MSGCSKLAQRLGEISEFRDRINGYYRKIGEQITATYDRLDKIEEHLNSMSNEINTIKETADSDRKEFHDFITTLAGDLEELTHVSAHATLEQVESEECIENPVQIESEKGHRKRS